MRYGPGSGRPTKPEKQTARTTRDDINAALRVGRQTNKKQGLVADQERRREDLRLLGKRSKQIQSGPPLHVLRDILNVTTGIPSTIEMLKHRPKDRNIEHMANVNKALPLIAGFGLGGPHIGIRPAAWHEGEGGGIPKGPGMPKTNADLKKLSAKAAKAELEKHSVRRAFHENIDKTVADKQIAAKMKQVFDREALKASKRAGISPGEHLDKLKTSERPEAAHKVTAGLSAGRVHAVQREQKALRHEELGKRVSKAEQALAQGTGEEAFRAAKRELKGPLPKAQFHGLRDLTSEEMDKLREHVHRHPDLTYFDKNTAWDAVLNAQRHGDVPAPHELRILNKAFGPQFVEKAFAPEGLAKYKNIAIETANIPRAVMSSADVSGVGRQNIVAISRHPVITGRNLKPMMKSLFSETHYRGRRQAVEANSYYEEAKEHGLAVTDMEHSLANREEPFQSNYAEKIPGFGHVVRGSGRAFTDFAVNNRLDIYSHLRQLADKQGYHLDRKALTDMTGYINSATGRGDLGRFEKSAVGMNAIFFSPRLVQSRLDFLLPWRYAGLDPFVRKQKLRAAAQFGAMLTSVLYLADQVPGVDVGIDPRSTDFGKVRIGDTRLDFTGGFSQYARLAAQLATNQKINPATGKPEKGKSLDTFWRFVRAKFSPSTSAAFDVGTRTQYSGQPLNWKAEVGSRAFPLGWQDAFRIYKNTGSIPAAAGGLGASAVGIGVQSYGPPTEQERRAGMSPEAKTAYDFKKWRTEAKAVLKANGVEKMPSHYAARLNLWQERTVARRKAGTKWEDHIAADLEVIYRHGWIDAAQFAAAKANIPKAPKNLHGSISKKLTDEYFDRDGILHQGAKEMGLRLPH